MMQDHETPRTAMFVGGPLDGERVPVGAHQSAVSPDDIVFRPNGLGLDERDYYLRLDGADLKFAHLPLARTTMRHRLDPDAAVWLSEHVRGGSNE